MTMDAPDDYTLFAAAITAALTASAQTPIDGLEGMTSAVLVATMLGGSGGTSIAVVAQISIDGGTTWLDVARFDFLTTAATKWAALDFTKEKAIASYAALASEGVNNGIRGARMRAVVTSVGTYTNTTASLRLSAA